MADSLRRELEKPALPDSLRIALLMDLGTDIYKDEAEEARQYFERAYNIALKNRDFYFMGHAEHRIGAIYHYQQDYDSAMYFYHLADSLFDLDESPLVGAAKAVLQSDRADVEKNKGHYERALQMLLEAVDRLKASDYWDELGAMYSNIGAIYFDMGQQTKTLEYDLKSLAMHRKNGKSQYGIVNSELFVAGDYLALGKHADAKVHIKRAESVAQHENSAVLFCRVFAYWGTYYRATGAYDKAIAHLQKAVRYARESNDVYHEMDCYRIIGYIYSDRQDYEKGLLFLNKALRLIRQLKNVSLEVEVLKRMASDQSAFGNKEAAVQAYEAYVQLSDSLNRQVTKVRINEIENRYQAKQKADSILVLQKSYQIQQLALRKKQSQNIFIIVGASLLLGISLLLYRHLRNRNRLLKQAAELHEQQLARLERERRLVAMQSVIKGQEEERSRLAKDLHDGVGGLLSGVKLSLSTMKGNVFLSEGNVQAVNNILAQLDRSIAELRQVSHNMMPEALIKFGLKETLENYCEEINSSGRIRVTFQAYGMAHRMEQNTEIILYRIVQELLNNVLKHAGAGKVLVQLTLEDKRFSLTVEDDGTGFDTQQAMQGKGAGLANVRARAEYLAGTVDIRSRPGEGTSVNIVGTVEDPDAAAEQETKMPR